MPLDDSELRNLSALEPALWSRLARGAFDPRYPYHFCSVATVNPAGTPESRMVVLRDCDPGRKVLAFHTDLRSGKVASLTANPCLSLLFWDPDESLQLRVSGCAELHYGDAEAQQRRAELRPVDRALYGFGVPPGMALTGPPEHNREPNEALVAQNFCWVEVHVESLEMLYLGRAEGHIRAQFKYRYGDPVGSTYVQA